MKLDLRKIAKKAVVFSQLMEGREKIETEDIIKYHKDKISIDAAERVQVPNGDEISTFYVYTFKEEPKKFAFSGSVLNKLFDTILVECQGDIEMFDKAFKEEPLQVKLSTGTTKNSGQQITLVEVL